MQIVPYRNWKADISTSSERIEEAWVVYGLCREDGATLLVVTWQGQKQEYVNYMKSVVWYRGVYSADLEDEFGHPESLKQRTK